MEKGTAEFDETPGCWSRGVVGSLAVWQGQKTMKRVSPYLNRSSQGLKIAVVVGLAACAAGPWTVEVVEASGQEKRQGSGAVLGMCS